MATIDVDAAQIAMGKWIAEYLNDAGYEDWAFKPQLYKLLVVNAFPPIDAIDGQAIGNEEMTPTRLENLMLKFLKVTDAHIHMKKRRLGVLNSLGLSNLLHANRG